jgi:hypothetical protein
MRDYIYNEEDRLGCTFRTSDPSTLSQFCGNLRWVCVQAILDYGRASQQIITLPTSCRADVVTVNFQVISDHELIQNTVHEGILAQHKALAYPNLRGHEATAILLGSVLPAFSITVPTVRVAYRSRNYVYRLRGRILDRSAQARYECLE